MSYTLNALTNSPTVEEKDNEIFANSNKKNDKEMNKEMEDKLMIIFSKLEKLNIYEYYDENIENLEVLDVSGINEVDGILKHASINKLVSSIVLFEYPKDFNFIYTFLTTYTTFTTYNEIFKM
jgi:hypothetical protein